MNFDLRLALPLLLPKAIAWAESRAAEIAASGRPLADLELGMATRVGVVHPERIRVALVSSLPLPTDPILKRVALETGLLGPNMVGLTLGHGVYICHGHISNRLLSHEFRHVYQYEIAGSIAAFLPIYLQQIVDVGYIDAPYEVDARAHSSDA